MSAFSYSSFIAGFGGGTRDPASVPAADPFVFAVGVVLAVLLPFASLEGQDPPGRTVSLEMVEGIPDRTVDSELLPDVDRWVRFGSGVSDDDQPLTTYSMALRGGLWLLPWLSTEVEAEWMDLDAGILGERAMFVRAVAGLRWERFDLEGALWGGGFRRSEIERGDWSGGGVVRYRGPSGLSLEVRSDRDTYLGTRASLTDSLTMTLIRGQISRRSATGWTGRISFTEALLSDDNQIDDARVWFLAPVVRGARAGFRAGYGLRAADSDENTYTAIVPWRLDFHGQLAGSYAGAYTPEEIVSHALLLQIWYDRPDEVQVHLDGSWGFHAREDRPVLVAAVPGAPESGIDLQFQEERYVPWDIRAEADFSILPGWDLRVGGGYRSSAFQGGGFAELGSSLSTPR